MADESEQTRLRAAVIGLGFIGAGDPVSGDAIGQQVKNLDGTHDRALAGNPCVELVAGSSRDSGRRRRFTERTGVERTYADWCRMLAAEELEIVCVATNSPYHAEITIACAEAGVRAVLCEKPIATRLVDADRMIAACAQHRTVLMVNHSRRWNPLWLAARAAIDTGEIGRVRHIAVHWPSGRLGNIGTHMFDAVRILRDGQPLAVSGTLDPHVAPDCRGPDYHDPGGWGVVRFEDDIKLFVDATQANKAPNEMRIVGEDGFIEVRRNDAVVATWAGARRIVTDDRNRPSTLDMAVAETVKCLRSLAPCTSTGEDGRTALEVIVGFHVSHRLDSRWVDLPLTGADRELEVRIG